MSAVLGLDAEEEELPLPLPLPLLPLLLPLLPSPLLPPPLPEPEPLLEAVDVDFVPEPVPPVAPRAVGEVSVTGVKSVLRRLTISRSERSRETYRNLSRRRQ
jgi:hypothetical protein